MKVAKLLLAAAIAAPSLFLTSCEKQIDVQADSVNREATRSLGKASPASFDFSFTPAVPADEVNGITGSSANLQAYNINITCGTGTFQQLVGTKWVDISAPLSLESIFIDYPFDVAPASGTQFRVSYDPGKGKTACPNNVARGGSNTITIP
jgi:hypothetical protein